MPAQHAHEDPSENSRSGHGARAGAASGYSLVPTEVGAATPSSLETEPRRLPSLPPGGCAPVVEAGAVTLFPWTASE